MLCRRVLMQHVDCALSLWVVGRQEHSVSWNVAWWPPGTPATGQGTDLTGEAVPPVRLSGAVPALAVAVQ